MFRNDETYVYAITHWPHFHAFISIEYWEKFVHAQAKTHLKNSSHNYKVRSFV